MLVLQETLQTSIWGFSPDCSPVKWKQTQHPSPSQLYPALVVLFLKNTLRAYLSVFITDWMLTENTGNAHLLSKCENLLSNLINLILKLCSTSYLESLIKKKKRTSGQCYSLHTELFHRTIFSNTPVLEGWRKTLFPAIYLEFTYFYKQPHVTLKCCLYMFHFMSCKALLFQEPISKTVFEVYFKFKHLSSKVKHLHC